VHLRHPFTNRGGAGCRSRISTTTLIASRVVTIFGSTKRSEPMVSSERKTRNEAWPTLVRQLIYWAFLFLLALVFSLPFEKPLTVDRLPDFNTYILRAINDISLKQTAKGYDIDSYFTHDLQYGNECCVPANNRPFTMCVAAVSEVIITAMNIFALEVNDFDVFRQLPLHSWIGRTRVDIRPYIFMFDEVRSRGTAHALETFGIGKQIEFNRLSPGDFINFNRIHTGHAVIFVGFIDKDFELVDVYNNNAVGFKYFSAQDKKRERSMNGSVMDYPAGFGYRWAFFDKFCPASIVGKPRDCGVFLSQNQEVLNTGYMLHPVYWNVERAVAKLQTNITQDNLRETLRPSSLSRYIEFTTH
jgi:hypothetical protein